jgi:hypothetical protein
MELWVKEQGKSVQTRRNVQKFKVKIVVDINAMVMVDKKKKRKERWSTSQSLELTEISSPQEVDISNFVINLEIDLETMEVCPKGSNEQEALIVVFVVITFHIRTLDQGGNLIAKEHIDVACSDITPKHSIHD